MTTQEKTVKSQHTQLHFARFEFKYIISESLRQEIEKEMLYFLSLDPFALELQENKYHVRSLYYDDSSYSCFQDKIAGLKTRSKFRIRTYTTDSNIRSPVFLEIKGRHNNLVFKHRTPISTTAGKLSQLSGNTLSTEVLNSTSDSTIKNQYEFELYRKNLKPITLIDYKRRPYFSKFDPGFRLTFDDELIATRTNTLFPDNKYFSKRILAGYTILEVKFRHHLPAWFHRIIQVYELQRISISKICAGMEVLGLTVDDNK